MIDWPLTTTQFGIDQSSKLGKRPRVICRCDNCPKTATITVRVKAKLKSGFPWLCPSCVGLARSEELSTQMKINWNDAAYRKMQRQFRSSDAYKQKQAASIKKKWVESTYRSKLATGIDRDEFINRSIANHGDKFDYTDTIFGSWKDPIDVKCRTCDHISRKLPQKQLDFGFCQKCNISTEQRELVDFINSLTPCTVNNKEIIAPYELDIYIESSRLAVEHHGVYWHSYDRPETTEEKCRHQYKARLCTTRNIKLLQFFDFEWHERRCLVESMLRHALHGSRPVAARKLQVVSISNQDARHFFDNNHLYGHRTAKYILALTDGDNIIIAISFSKHRDGYEIIRLATAAGVNVMGGASRLISHFRPRYGGQL